MQIKFTIFLFLIGLASLSLIVFTLPCYSDSKSLVDSFSMTCHPTQGNTLSCLTVGDNSNGKFLSCIKFNSDDFKINNQMLQSSDITSATLYLNIYSPPTGTINQFGVYLLNSYFGSSTSYNQINSNISSTPNDSRSNWYSTFVNFDVTNIVKSWLSSSPYFTLVVKTIQNPNQNTVVFCGFDNCGSSVCNNKGARITINYNPPSSNTKTLTINSIPTGLSLICTQKYGHKVKIVYS